MRALTWQGKHDVRVETVPDPEIVNPRDAIIRITSTAICGSDLHLYDHTIPGMKSGDILGHEFMGEVVDVGPAVKNLKKGDRVIVPFAIACGGCFYCKKQLWSLCDNSNPNAWMLEKLYGDSGAGLFGYSHLYGGYAGGQAQYARVPFADTGPFKVPEGLSDEQPPPPAPPPDPDPAPVDPELEEILAPNPDPDPEPAPASDDPTDDLELPE